MTGKSKKVNATAWFLVVAGLNAAGQQLPPSPTFVDATEAAGIRFRRDNGASGRYLYPELFGGGVAVLDVDGDRWPDLLFVNGSTPAGSPSAASARNKLYQNTRNGTFRDVSSESGLELADLYGLGAAVADYDNDGRDDVFITSVDGGRLFRNTGGGHFVDVTRTAGIANRDFAVSAAWLDYNRDGLADLFIGNYVEWSPDREVNCSSGGSRGYCGPDAYRPRAPKLYRNRGGGRFEDATNAAGLGEPVDKAMGVAVLDYDMDGWPDLLVANDRVPARLLRNDRRGGFADDAVRAGIALSENGRVRANMGVDAADFDRSGHPDVVVGNFTNEMLGLYRNEGGGHFVDVAPRSEVGRASLLYVTWAVFFLDYDLDGFLDIFAVNGGTDESQGRDARARVSQPPLMLRNRGDGTFENVTPSLGTALNQAIMGRGAAYADFDGDGDLDIAVATLAGPAFLLRNDAASGRNWLRVRAVGSRSNRSGLGAVVRVTSPSGRQWQMVRSGSSYASQSELTLTFGLGQDRSVSAIEVTWPSGVSQTFSNAAVNQTITIDEAKGIVLGR
jgi:hypothetical protein